MSTTQDERNAEIWSTRIQRELLALTTDNADLDETAEVRAALPPFVTVKEHALDISAGTCRVSFEVTVALPKSGESDEDGSAVLVITLDASLPRKDDGTGAIDPNKPAYPFGAPIPLLTSGQACFPSGSTIQDGDRIDMDLDWTPSLHLTDAILNIGLKVKESILQHETFHAAPTFVDPIDEMAVSARRFASNLTKKASTSIRALSEQGRKSFSHATHKQQQQQQPKKKKPERPVQAAGDVRIGDEINLLEEPWVDAQGVYSCKAIRRPEFVEDIMRKAAQEQEKESFSSPTAMFRSFAQSARNVLEESFLMITVTHIIEMKSSKLNMSTGTVTFAIPISQMAKLKFRRQESVSLFFKAAVDDPLIYMCPDAGDAVHQIQSVLKRQGVKGKHTNAAAHRAINEALHVVQEIQTKELALKHDPTVERVNEIMDLYRQAAERFEVAGDIRHEEVVTHMRKFLALPLTTSILDGSYKKPTGKQSLLPAGSSANNKGEVPQGEILERSDHGMDEELDEHGVPSKKKEQSVDSDKAFQESMDNLLKEAQQDLEKFMVDGDDTLKTEADTASADDDDDASDDGNALADVAADLDAMMKEADKELAELMSS